MKNLLTILTALIFLSSALQARTLRVPSQYPTIQAGIDSSVDGDTVLVADGTYIGEGNRNIRFNGRIIVVRSENGPESCIIDGENANGGFVFTWGDSSLAAMVEGFKIINGRGHGSDGGGIYCNHGCATIRNCIVVNCRAIYGGGIYIDGSSPVFEDCIIRDNVSFGYCGGIHCDASPGAVFNRCLITGNVSNNIRSYQSAGIWCRYSNPVISNCTISGNTINGTTLDNGAGIFLGGCEAEIVNTIVEGNIGGGGVFLIDSPNSTISYCDFHNNHIGSFIGTSIPPGLGLIDTVNANRDSCDRYFNIYLYPDFYAYTGDSAYYLSVNSPGIDAGNPAYPFDPDSTIKDIGAYHRRQGPPTINVVLLNPPVRIPAGGGLFSYDVIIHNTSASAVTFLVTEGLLPPGGGHIYGPIIYRPDLIIQGGETIQRRITQWAPSFAPAGTFWFVAEVGIEYGRPVDDFWFPVEKLAGDGLSNHNQGWACYGWDDEKSHITNHKSKITNLAVSPNPFNPTTDISFKLRAASNLKLAVYDVSGREVARLVDGFYPAGTHQVLWDASMMASGVYFARLETGAEIKTEKLLLVK